VADPRVNVMREVRRVPDRYVLIRKIRLVSSRKLRCRLRDFSETQGRTVSVSRR